MKNKFFRIIALTVAILLMAMPCFAAASTIKINGTVAEIPADMGAIQEKDDRTFVPVRFVSEFLEYDVGFDEETRTITVVSNDLTVIMQDGNSTLFVVPMETGDTKTIMMDTAVYIDNAIGRTYIPIRFLAEAFNYTVGWDEETQTVTLDK